MAITYINGSFLKDYKIIHEIHTNNATTVILRKSKDNKIVLKQPNTFTEIKEKKLIFLDSIKDLPITYPTHILIDDKGLNSFITDYVPEENFDILDDFTTEEKIDYLVKAKENLEILHNNGIIHGDIKSLNILATTNPIFCDIDDCIIKDLSLDMESPNYFYQNYLKRTNQIDQNLDKYEFNIMTYCIMNNLRSPYLIEHRIKSSIEANNFGIFKSKDNIKIIKRLLTFKDSYKDDYLIDSLKNGIC